MLAPYRRLEVETKDGIRVNGNHISTNQDRLIHIEKCSNNEVSDHILLIFTINKFCILESFNLLVEAVVKYF